MSRKRPTLAQGSIYLRNDWWWCNYVAGGVRRRESCKTNDPDEALASYTVARADSPPANT